MKPPPLVKRLGTSLITTNLYNFVVPAATRIMEEENEDDDLREIEENEIHVKDDLWPYNKECRNDKETIGDDELHLKLIPLLIGLNNDQ